MENHAKSPYTHFEYFTCSDLAPLNSQRQRAACGRPDELAAILVWITTRINLDQVLYDFMYLIVFKYNKFGIIKTVTVHRCKL